MIAPLGEPRASRDDSRRLAHARRAVAAALFRRSPSSEPPPAPRVATLTAWWFVVWALAVAASYFACGAWWTIPPR